VNFSEGNTHYQELLRLTYFKFYVAFRAKEGDPEEGSNGIQNVDG